jgi:hypothetical protein
MVRNPRLFSCEGKKIYLSWSAASGEGRFLKRRFGERLMAYRCRYCGGWHLGGRA